MRPERAAQYRQIEWSADADTGPNQPEWLNRRLARPNTCSPTLVPSQSPWLEEGSNNRSPDRGWSKLHLQGTAKVSLTLTGTYSVCSQINSTL